MYYTIETVINENWEREVGEPNIFETEEEAEEMIPSLARIFGCGEEEFRVRELTP